MQLFANFLQVISSHILPSACISCETFQRHTVCPACINLIAQEQLSNYECCSQCGITLLEQEIALLRCQDCVSNPPYFDQTLCLDRYDGRLQKALIQLKYQRRLSFAHGLSHIWNKLVDEDCKNFKADYLFPVPLSQEKLCIRGFNQSWELAKRINCGSHIQKTPHILMRHHYEHPQARENRVNRHKAIHEMFYVNPKFQAALQGRTIIVFDDVMTSGATLNEIARILKDNGVHQVINWVLLRTLHQR